MANSKNEVYLNTKYQRLWDTLYGAGLIAFWALMTIVFYRQTIRYDGRYASDTQFYVEYSKDKYGDRLISYVFHWLYNAFGNNWGIAVYMGAVVTLTIIANYYLIRYILRSDGIRTQRLTVQALSVMMLFTGSIYLPGVFEKFYAKCWSTYAWHSPTQHTMMLFAVISIMLFLMIYENYLDRIDISKWLILMITSMLSTWSKPSFILVMTPTVIILFLIELFTRKEHSFGVRLRQLVLFGMAFVPSGLLMLYLNTRYFGEGESSDGGALAFGLKHFLEDNSSQLLIKILCGLMFPIIVFAFNYGRFGEMKLKLAITMLITSTVEWMLIYEEGSRASHGNFSWGKKLGCYYFFLCALCLAVENFKDKQFLGGNKAKRTIYFTCIGIFLAMHLLSQLYYFYAIVRGHKYYF